ncbi:MAG: insulinase family protein [Candidatus Heimdallarchaeota archaeon]|nr:insulinase family protein [Candidatus Heimdallarchaeota archaeon]MDH5646873.1 insulinase family protein [Candidatus Heimdallarchaeota archaeon]
MSGFDVRKLKNGVPVLLAHYDEGETVTIGITYNVGGRNEWENKSLDGISHFLEHQFFKGNEHISPNEVLEKVDELGGMTNAFTMEDCTIYFSKCMSSELDNAISLWDELLTFGVISQEEFDKEAFVVRQEFRRAEDSPGNLIYRKVKKELFKNTSLEMDVIGTEESLSSMTLDQMERYRAKYYGMENCALLIVGNFDKEELFTKLNSTFGNKKFRDEKPKYQLTQYNIPKENKINVIRVEKETPLVFYDLAILTPGRKSKHYHAIELLSHLISLGRSSLIQQRLIRKGLCSYAYLYYNYYEDIGSLEFYAASSPHQIKESLDTTFILLHDVLTMEITSDTLAKLCDKIEYQVLSAFEDPSQLMQLQSIDYWRNGRFITLEDQMKAIRDVTIEDFDEVRQLILGNLQATLGVLGKSEDINFELTFPENTWKGEFIS